MTEQETIDYVAINLKAAIQGAGYRIVDFPVEFLGCTYQTFNWRLNNGQFHVKDLIFCMEKLNVTLEDLIKPVKIKKRKKYERTKEPSIEPVKEVVVPETPEVPEVIEEPKKEVSPKVPDIPPTKKDTPFIDFSKISSWDS